VETSNHTNACALQPVVLQLIRFMQWALYTVQTCDEVGLSVNPNKTELILTRKRKLPGFFEPHFLGLLLCCCMSVNYLGVFLDSWLTCREHVDVKVKKAYSLLWACSVTRGLRPKVVHWFYVSYHSAVHHSCILTLVAWLMPRRD